MQNTVNHTRICSIMGVKGEERKKQKNIHKIMIEKFLNLNEKHYLHI